MKWSIINYNPKPSLHSKNKKSGHNLSLFSPFYPNKVHVFEIRTVRIIYT